MQANIRNALALVLDVSHTHLQQIAAHLVSSPLREAAVSELEEKRAAIATLRGYLAQIERLDVPVGTSAACAVNTVCVETMERHTRANGYRILRSDLGGYYFEKDDFASEDHAIREDPVCAAYSHMQENGNVESAPGTDDKQEWTPCIPAGAMAAGTSTMFVIPAAHVAA